MEKLAAFDLVDPTKIPGQDFHVAGGDRPGEGLPGPGELMHRLTDLAAGYNTDTVFLSNSGAEAVENAIKICYDHRDGATVSKSEVFPEERARLSSTWGADLSGAIDVRNVGLMVAVEFDSTARRDAV